MKASFFCLLICFIGVLNGFSQSSTTDLDSIAVLSHEISGNSVIYSFKPIKEYNELRTLKSVSRINDITGDNATVKFNKQKIFIAINPELTAGSRLETLLVLIVRIHGYSNFELK